MCADRNTPFAEAAVTVALTPLVTPMRLGGGIAAAFVLVVVAGGAVTRQRLKRPARRMSTRQRTSRRRSLTDVVVGKMSERGLDPAPPELDACCDHVEEQSAAELQRARGA